MKKMNEVRVENLFKYMEILTEAQKQGHSVRNELNEVIQTLRIELGLNQMNIKFESDGSLLIGSKEDGIKIAKALMDVSNKRGIRA